MKLGMRTARAVNVKRFSANFSRPILYIFARAEICHVIGTRDRHTYSFVLKCDFSSICTAWAFLPLLSLAQRQLKGTIELCLKALSS